MGKYPRVPAELFPRPHNKKQAIITSSEEIKRKRPASYSWGEGRLKGYFPKPTKDPILREFQKIAGERTITRHEFGVRLQAALETGGAVKTGLNVLKRDLEGVAKEFARAKAKYVMKKAREKAKKGGPLGLAAALVTYQKAKKND